MSTERKKEHQESEKSPDFKALEDFAKALIAMDRPKDALEAIAEGEDASSLRAVRTRKLTPVREDERPEKFPHIFKDRPVIREGSQIVGGVYIGDVEKEAVVVSEEYGELDRVYNHFLVERKKALEQGALNKFKESILTDTYHYVLDLIPFDPEIFRRIETSRNPGDKVPLDTYIKIEGGTIRHQVLLIAYMLERFIFENRLKGSVSVKQIIDKAGKGHAYVEYTTKRGEKIIIDPAVRMLGLRQNLPTKAQYST